MNRPTVAQLLVKAREFTDIEDRCLNSWLIGELKALGFDLSKRDDKLDDLAQRILDTGLFAEHFNSLLAAIPNERTVEEQSKLLELHGAFEKTLDELVEK